MKKRLYLLTILVLLFSCEKYPEPGSELLETFNYVIIGNNQLMIGAEYLPLKVGAKIDLNSLVTQSDKKFRMEILVASGNGSVDNTVIEANSNGEMLTKWKLGEYTNTQIITCKIFDSENNFYSEFNIEATTFFKNRKNKITSGYLVGIDDMVCDTTHQRTMMFNEGQVWILKDDFYSWEPKNFPFNEYVRFLDMTSDGTVFAAGWRGALYKTEDWGDNWQYVCHPIPENEHFYNFNITSDDYLWATKYPFGISCSKDKGLTWTRDTTERVKNSDLGPIYKYQNSYMTIAGQSIVQKQADSSDWQDINTPEYLLSMYIPNDSTIIAQTKGGGGLWLHKSTDNGLTYKQVFSPSTSLGGSDRWHSYNKFGNNYLVLAQTSGLWLTKDFNEFEQLITIKKFESKLFIDHAGTIYVAGLNYTYASDDATYILPGMQ
uniref:hypothetical protein n=1 Tax=uncultured Draconibacterium sp. TaxID=1573823 RepID=UPI003217CBB0